MKYRTLDHTAEFSLSELIELAGGGSPLGAPPDERLFENASDLFPKGYIRGADLRETVQTCSAAFELFGTADGVFCENGKWGVDVIRMADPRELRSGGKREWKVLSQLLAFLLAKREGAREITVRLILVSRTDGEIKTTVKKESYEALEGTAQTLLSLLAFRVNMLIEREKTIRPSAASAPFPYAEIREGQEEMIRRAMTVMRKGKKLFACAPTGIGKTVSALYPAVRAFGEGLCDKIFYLTAKTSTSLEAYQTAGKLFEAGARLRTIVLGAKEGMCHGNRGNGKYCNERDCSYLRGDAPRMQEAIRELIAKQNGYYSSVIRETALKYRVCPYELSLSLSEYCDIIICDYNYLFDPIVRLRRYFCSDGRFGEYIFLLDEAHNLVDRARGMFTATFSRSRIEATYNVVNGEDPALGKAFAPLVAAAGALSELCRENRQTVENGKSVGYYIGQARAEHFDTEVLRLHEKLVAWLRANHEHALYDLVNDFSREMQRYAAILARYDEKFVTYIEEEADETEISLICIDPSEVVGEMLDVGRASVLFSATLTPLSYFSDLLGGDKSSVFLELSSPYEAENLCVAAVDSLSTRFEDRDKTYKKAATYIAAAVSAKRGNYMVYFPSYSYLEKVHEAFVKKYPDVCTIVQKKGMNLAEKEAFLAAFPEDSGKMRIGFCVLGGSFSEGVDLPGSRLIGSIILGTGLPGLSSERNIMRDYFQNRYDDGFAYAYTYAGMNNVLQAAGRVIRREEDKGIVVLIDDRYGTPTYQKLFPKHWEHLKYAGNPASLAEIARKFWEKSK
ncbi:MAG: ATP-dependent DNA helicase [Clostridia bacterium]|nr:ATP-dependent DNA helicase [Clostridia bacterium]